MSYLSQASGASLDEHKLHLEFMLLHHPDSGELLDAYMTVLRALAGTSFGLLQVSMPRTIAPLFLRGSSSDVLNLRQIFLGKEYDFKLSKPPEHILDLGAYAGYAAVFLANRFPNAEILCVEPSEANFRLLTLNTLPYDNIRRVRGAVWHRPTQLALAQRIGGHWGSIFGEQSESAQDSVRAYTVDELVQIAGWQHIDYLKCDIEGAEIEVFSDPRISEWLPQISCASIETHDRFRPGATKAVEAAFPAALYDHRRSGEFHVYTRADPNPGAALTAESPPTPGPILLSPASMRLTRFDLINVPEEEWGFRIIDDTTFQLHPNGLGEKRSEVSFHIELARQGRFSAICSLPKEARGNVCFSVRVAIAGKNLIEECCIAAPGQAVKMGVELGKRCGPCDLILGTEMTQGAQSCGFAWARWTDARLQ